MGQSPTFHLIRITNPKGQEGEMEKWVIRFRVIAPYDYHTPMMHLPIEETIVEAETADEAWEKWVTDPYAAPRDHYRKIEVYKTA